MTVRIVLLALSLLTATAAPAQTTNAPANSGFSAERFRAHVTFLADDALEGRDTGSRGNEIAATYVASQFLGLGLQPGGENGGWYQRVPFRSAALRGTPRVTISSAAGTQTWENWTDVLIGPNLQAEALDFQAQAVFAGYGIDAPDLGISDYRGLDVRGKIVVVLGGAPTDIPSEIAAHLADTKEAMAARHGAIGLITIYTDTFAAVQPWQRVTARRDRAALAWLDREGNPNVEAREIRASALFNDPAAAALFAGARRSYAQVRAEAARPGAHPRGFALTTRLRIQATSAWTQISSPAVIGVLPGGDPALRTEHVALMAHLDHVGMRSDGEDRIYNGALDNAAGIATMIEAARAFVELGERPRRSILFIANTAEEKGLLGADYFARYPTVPIGSIVAGVDLDMPLLLYRFTDVIAFGADHSTVAQAVASAATEMGVTLSPDPMPEENIFVRSDHYQFVRQGVPAILLATGFANGGAQAWQGFLGGAYHQVNDDLSQPIDWESGARYAQLNYLISRTLADADERPRWYRGDYFGDLFAPNSPRAERPAR